MCYISTFTKPALLIWKPNDALRGASLCERRAMRAAKKDHIQRTYFLNKNWKRAMSKVRAITFAHFNRVCIFSLVGGNCLHYFAVI